MTSNDFRKEILKYDVKKFIVPYTQKTIQYIFSQVQTPCCYLYKEYNNCVRLAHHIKFTVERPGPRIQYYKSVSYYFSSYDLIKFKKQLANLYSQLQTAIKQYKDYNLNLKLKRINHDF